MARPENPIPYFTFYNNFKNIGINKSATLLLPFDYGDKLYATIAINNTHTLLRIDIHKEYYSGDHYLSPSKQSCQYHFSGISMEKSIPQELLVNQYRIYQNMHEPSNILYLKLVNKDFYELLSITDTWKTIPMHQGIQLVKHNILNGVRESNKTKSYCNRYTFQHSARNIEIIDFTKYKLITFKYDETINKPCMLFDADIFKQGINITQIKNKDTITINIHFDTLKVLATLLNKPIDFDDLPNLPKHIYLEIDKHPTIKDAVVIKDIYTQKACVLKSSTCKEE